MRQNGRTRQKRSQLQCSKHPPQPLHVENVETGNTATPETAAEPETQLQEETVEQEESAIQTAETAALQQEPEAETAVQALAAEPDSLGKVWLTEIFPNDFDDHNKNEYGTTDDRFEYIELINTADTPVNLTTDYELVYGTKADNAKPFAVQETDGSDVVLQPGEVTVVWNQRTNVKNPGTVEDFRSNYMIPDNVHIVISQYGKDWANTGHFGLRARATGTVCATTATSTAQSTRTTARTLRTASAWTWPSPTWATA